MLLDNYLLQWKLLLLDKVHNDGKYLEIIDLVLRVIHNIKNYGESLAQVIEKLLNSVTPVLYFHDISNY